MKKVTLVITIIIGSNSIILSQKKIRIKRDKESKNTKESNSCYNSRFDKNGTEWKTPCDTIKFKNEYYKTLKRINESKVKTKTTN